MLAISGATNDDTRVPMSHQHLTKPRPHVLQIKEFIEAWTEANAIAEEMAKWQMAVSNRESWEE